MLWNVCELVLFRNLLGFWGEFSSPKKKFGPPIFFFGPWTRCLFPNKPFSHTVTPRNACYFVFFWKYCFFGRMFIPYTKKNIPFFSFAVGTDFFWYPLLAGTFCPFYEPYHNFALNYSHTVITRDACGMVFLGDYWVV
jgi:hypothetical protein